MSITGFNTEGLPSTGTDEPAKPRMSTAERPDGEPEMCTCVPELEQDMSKSSEIASAATSISLA